MSQGLKIYPDNVKDMKKVSLVAPYTYKETDDGTAVNDLMFNFSY